MPQSTCHCTSPQSADSRTPFRPFRMLNAHNLTILSTRCLTPRPSLGNHSVETHISYHQKLFFFVSICLPLVPTRRPSSIPLRPRFRAYLSLIFVCIIPPAPRQNPTDRIYKVAPVTRASSKFLEVDVLSRHGDSCCVRTKIVKLV